MNNDLRLRIAELVYQSKEGHIPSSYSIVDIIEFIYGNVLQFNAADHKDANRDYFILSKGHGCAALWVVLEKLSLLSPKVLNTYSQFGSILGGHPDRTKVPFVEASTGSLGHGLPMAVGIALGLQIQSRSNQVLCLVGDGECHEGTIWESAHIAANRQLGNLTVVVDWNKSAAQLCPIDELPDKWTSFGWHVNVFDGHEPRSIQNAFETRNHDKPNALIAINTKGKGVSFLEGHGAWHHKIPSMDELNKIRAELS